MLGGTLVHFVKSKTKVRRPANYSHVSFGLFIIGLAFWQVRTGYSREYLEWTTGRAPKGVNTLWIVWVVVIPLAYIAGLALVPRQFRQEKTGLQAKQQLGN